jgi:hypothetical protein
MPVLAMRTKYIPSATTSTGPAARAFPSPLLVSALARTLMPFVSRISSAALVETSSSSGS